MASADRPCRIFIVYSGGLFAEGIRSLLEELHVAEIVGMERDARKTLRTVRHLKPDVVIVEETAGKEWSPVIGTLLRQGIVARVVLLSLNHHNANIYHNCRIPATSSANLVKAIHDDIAQMSLPPDATARPRGGGRKTSVARI